MSEGGQPSNSRFHSNTVLQECQYQCLGNDGAEQEPTGEAWKNTSGSLTVFLFILLQRSVWRAAARGTETAPNLASACEYE